MIQMKFLLKVFQKCPQMDSKRIDHYKDLITDFASINWLTVSFQISIYKDFKSLNVKGKGFFQTFDIFLKQYSEKTLD